MSISGSRYFVTFIDDYTQHTWACFIEKKSEVFSCFLKMKSLARRETGRKIKCLRTNGRNSTVLTSSRVICRRKEFNKIFPANTRRKKTAWPNGRTGQSKKRQGKCSRRRAYPSSTRSKRLEWPCTFKIGHLQLEVKCCHMSCTSRRSRTWRT